MPGPQKGQGGRPPKPLAMHIAEGTYNATRHADRNEVHADGEAIDLIGLESIWPHGAKLFGDLVERLSQHGFATGLDSANLSAMCYWWGEFVAISTAEPLASQQAEASRQIRKDKAFTQFAKIAGQYGLSPTARASLNESAPTAETNPFERFLEASKRLS